MGFSDVLFVLVNGILGVLFIATAIRHIRIGETWHPWQIWGLRTFFDGIKRASAESEPVWFWLTIFTFFSMGLLLFFATGSFLLSHLRSGYP